VNVNEANILASVPDGLSTPSSLHVNVWWPEMKRRCLQDTSLSWHHRRQQYTDITSSRSGRCWASWLSQLDSFSLTTADATPRRH